MLHLGFEMLLLIFAMIRAKQGNLAYTKLGCFYLHIFMLIQHEQSCCGTTTYNITKLGTNVNGGIKPMSKSMYSFNR